MQRRINTSDGTSPGDHALEFFGRQTLSRLPWSGALMVQLSVMLMHIWISGRRWSLITTFLNRRLCSRTVTQPIGFGINPDRSGIDIKSTPCKRKLCVRTDGRPNDLFRLYSCQGSMLIWLRQYMTDGACGIRTEGCECHWCIMLRYADLRAPPMLIQTRIFHRWQRDRRF